MILDTNKIHEFANRLNYTPINGLKNNMYVDHINKEYNKNIHPYYILFDILLWNTPEFIYNVIKTSLKNCFNYNITNYHFAKALLFSDSITISNEYRNSDLYKILHPCINPSLRNDFSKVISILLSKAFDKEDNYFNSTKNISILNLKQEEYYRKFIHYVSFTDLILSGSNALAFYGSVYRNKIKDFDFIVNYDKLPKPINDVINNEILYNNITYKDRLELEHKIKDLFEDSQYYSNLSTKFDYNISLLKAIIDRTTECNDFIKIIFILNYKNIEFNLIFRHDTNFNIENIYDCLIRVQDVNDELYAKKLLGRPKDFQDFINFKPYKKLNNNYKCVVNYE